VPEELEELLEVPEELEELLEVAEELEAVEELEESPPLVDEELEAASDELLAFEELAFVEVELSEAPDEELLVFPQAASDKSDAAARIKRTLFLAMIKPSFFN
jgi:hypothetical protein